MRKRKKAWNLPRSIQSNHRHCLRPLPYVRNAMHSHPGLRRSPLLGAYQNIILELLTPTEIGEDLTDPGPLALSRRLSVGRGSDIRLLPPRDDYRPN